MTELTDWKRLIFPGELRAAKVGALSEMVILTDRLAGCYETPEEVAQWLRSPQPLLDDRMPVDLIADGKASELHRVWDSLDAGAYI